MLVLYVLHMSVVSHCFLSSFCLSFCRLSFSVVMLGTFILRHVGYLHSPPCWVLSFSAMLSTSATSDSVSLRINTTDLAPSALMRTVSLVCLSLSLPRPVIAVSEGPHDDLFSPLRLTVWAADSSPGTRCCHSRPLHLFTALHLSRGLCIPPAISPACAILSAAAAAGPPDIGR